MTSIQGTQTKEKSSRSQLLLAWVLEHKADLVLGAFFTLLTVVYAFFMFRDRIPTWGLISLVGLWLLHLALAGWRRTPMDVLSAALLGLSLVSLSISIDRALTLPKVHGLVLGLSLFYFVVNAVRTKKMLQLAVFGLLALALGVSVLGLVGTEWYNEKILDLSAVYETLPQWIDSIPRYVNQGGIHRNLIGGALTFFLPLLASLLWDVWRVDFSAISRKAGWARTAKIGIIVLLILGTLLTAFVLVLTQSRGGYLGAFVGLLTLAVIKDRRYLWAIPLLGIILLTVIQRTASGDPEIFLALIDTTRGGTLPGRMEIWQRATLLIQDFPFSGAGLGTFSPLTNSLYPYFRGGDPEIPHAHNMVLTMAVDLGIPGLILYTGLVSAFFTMILKTVKNAGRWTRALLIGMACGLLAHQVFGIMDAYMLGTKLGAILWIFFGLGTAAYRLDQQKGRGDLPALIGRPSRPHAFGRSEACNSWLCQFGIGLSAWLLLSMLAIAFVNINVVVSLVLALLGGGILGVGLVGADQRKTGSRGNDA